MPSSTNEMEFSSEDFRHVMGLDRDDYYNALGQRTTQVASEPASPLSTDETQIEGDQELGHQQEGGDDIAD